MGQTPLFDIFFFCSFPSIILGAVYFARLSKPTRVLWVYLILSWVAEATSLYLAYQYSNSYFNERSNFWPQIMLFFYTLYFYYALKIKPWNRLVPILGIGLILLLSGYILFFSTFQTDNSPLTLGAAHFYLLFGVLVQFYQLISAIAQVNLTRHSQFYTNAGLLFYVALAVMGHVGVSLMGEYDQLGYLLWNISLVGWIIFNIFLLIAIILEIRKWDPSLPSSS